MGAQRLLGAFLFLGLSLAQGTLTLYTSEVLADVNALVEAFRRANPGVEVKVFRSGTGEVVAKVRAELQAGNPQADLLWFANEDFLKELASKGFLRRIPPTVPGYPVQYAPGGGLYYEVRLLYNVIGLNRKRVGRLPALWQDLLRPEYQGLLAMPDPNFSGAALATVGTLGGRFGMEFFARLKENGLKVEQSNPVLQQKLARGEYGVAITTDFGLRQEIAKGAPLEVVYPRDGAILVPTPVAVPVWSKSPELASRFLRFLLSPEAQAIFAERGYYPVMPGAPRPKGAPERVVSVRGRFADAATLERFNALFGLRR
ncbi:ABC transporter substrate-binding protein (plasmid) [Thermus thermophilus]|uniref:ABC transporter substrate-binding protein n=1 Tax=Thermus thermophilus TaxID=274 RepID=UPI0003AA0CE1|nr:ABC transporter substrate-binding protein [Thermus thermophilus]BCP99095.1 ABC transporter substrate-binding protein [Thermus thermophilus]BCQ01513.1 ABC transporter substrate-binding protein [Thermus thermophilus]BDG25342.1 ABC transporter substrate-binding protein [Thermus thermophilus]BDG29900.1 ABC transporter substrate-binding protein [Thermus thermophilus]